MSAEFEAALRERESSLEANWALFQALQAEHDAVAREAFRAHFPGRRWASGKSGEIPGVDALRAPFLARAAALSAARADLERAFGAKLRGIAAAAPLPRTAGMTKVQTVRGGDFHTQGLRAGNYARASALRHAAKAVACGLKAEARKCDEAERADRAAPRDHAVWADTSELGWKMVQLKPDPPFRDVLRVLMRAGANPRVFYPSLPWGAEGKLGLDDFGNDLPGWAAAVPATLLGEAGGADPEPDAAEEAPAPGLV